ncbi:DUF975 family protein [bacterium]|nr:DUF975 family protein [bacterium]
MKTRQEIKTEAKKILAAHRGQVSIYYVIWSLIVTAAFIVLSLAAGLLLQFSAASGVITVIALLIAMVAVLAPMMFAFYDYPLHLIKGESVSLSMLWSGWKSANYARSLWLTLRYVGWMILLYLVVFVPLAIVTLVAAYTFGYSLLSQTSMPGVSVQAIVADDTAFYDAPRNIVARPSTTSILLVFLLIILLIVVSFLAFMWLDATYSQAYFIITGDPQTTTSQAITLAKTLMKGHRWQYMVFTMSFWGWFLLSALMTIAISSAVESLGTTMDISGVKDLMQISAQLLSTVITAYLATSYLMTAKAVFFRELVAESTSANAQTSSAPLAPAPTPAAAPAVNTEMTPQA